MALLKSANVPGLDYHEYRDGLFYNKYEYRVRFRLEGIQLLWRVNSPESLARLMDIDIHNWNKPEHKQKLQDNRDILMNFIIWKKENCGRNKHCSVRTEGRRVSVFSNDLALIKTIEAINPGLKYDYTKAIVSQYSGVKLFSREPKYKYRVYLKSTRISEQLRTELRDFFDKNKNLSCSNSFKKWFKKSSMWRQHWLSATYSIDYNDESTISYLMLMYSDIIGKKFKLEKVPDTQ